MFIDSDPGRGSSPWAGTGARYCSQISPLHPDAKCAFMVVHASVVLHRKLEPLEYLRLNAPGPCPRTYERGKRYAKLHLKCYASMHSALGCVGFYCLVHAHTHSNRKRSVFRDAFLEFLVIGGEDSLCLFVRFVNRCESANQ